MSEGCTNCGSKAGCSHRKTGMFAVIEDALARLYPTRSWSDRRDDGEPAGGFELAERLADRLAVGLKTLALAVAGGAEEYCDHVYLLCLGRQPSLLEMREGVVPREAPPDAVAGIPIEELYLRIALSTVAPVAAVQQVTLRGDVGATDLVLEEETRAGVFDPVLLPRFRSVVAVLAELGLENLDFGDIFEPPAGYDPGDYGARYGGQPAVANYLFYPQPCSSITTTVLPLAVGSLVGDTR